MVCDFWFLVGIAFHISHFSAHFPPVVVTENGIYNSSSLNFNNHIGAGTKDLIRVKPKSQITNHKLLTQQLRMAILPGIFKDVNELIQALQNPVLHGLPSWWSDIRVESAMSIMLYHPASISEKDRSEIKSCWARNNQRRIAALQVKKS